MEFKRPLIMFSGGLDSTYLLVTTLLKESCDVLTVNTNIINEVHQKKLKIKELAELLNKDESTQSKIDDTSNKFTLITNNEGKS